jgi:restriction endonuclease
MLNKEEKEKAIKKEIQKLKKLFIGIEEDKENFVNNLIKEIAFMKTTLSELQEDINTNGTMELFTQGSQKFQRESPSVKSYNALIKNYSQLNKELMLLLPKDKKGTSLSDMMKLLEGDDE